MKFGPDLCIGLSDLGSGASCEPYMRRVPSVQKHDVDCCLYGRIDGFFRVGFSGLE